MKMIFAISIGIEKHFSNEILKSVNVHICQAKSKDEALGSAIRNTDLTEWMIFSKAIAQIPDETILEEARLIESQRAADSSTNTRRAETVNLTCGKCGNVRLGVTADCIHSKCDCGGTFHHVYG